MLLKLKTNFSHTLNLWVSAVGLYHIIFQNDSNLVCATVKLRSVVLCMVREYKTKVIQILRLVNTPDNNRDKRTISHIERSQDHH